MKIIKVIHGYPMRYNAGSEVYSQMLCQGLADHQHQVHVFTREEDPFLPDYFLKTETDPADARIILHLINLPAERLQYQYRHSAVDKQFANLLAELQPDIIHIGHLNHLSTSLIKTAKANHIPIVFTLHDYWLMCPRGQFMQRSGTPTTLWAVCDGQTDHKCATHCYAGCASGAENEWQQDKDYWQSWVARRMQHVKEMANLVDFFIAPSRYLYERFVNNFNIPKNKITYLDYGFDLNRFKNPRQRSPSEVFTFGYIGTHIPAKGIQHLIQAFGLLTGPCKLRIWGRASQHTVALKNLVKTLPLTHQNNIEWMGEYNNAAIVEAVFNKLDCIVVPSIWVENSPLVIHEALQTRVAVITADVGGMAEYIQHHVNGLLFKHREPHDLAAHMQSLVNNPALALKLGSRGYLQAQDGNIPAMATHLKQIETIYDTLLNREKTL